MKVTLPSPEDIQGIAEFAESFNGYEWCGSVLAAAEHARARPRRSMQDLHAELFFAFRASRHADDNQYVAVYRELMWHFLRVGRETGTEIEISGSTALCRDSSAAGRLALIKRTDIHNKLVARGVSPSAQMPQKTYLELQKEIEALQVEASLRRREEAIAVLARMKDAIKVYGFTASDLGLSASAAEDSETFEVPIATSEAGTSSVKPPCKYRDDEGNIWSGRGPRPTWFRQALASGKTTDDLLAN